MCAAKCVDSPSVSCCQKDNCNAASEVLPVKNVTSCYYGIQSGSQAMTAVQPCTSPANGFCQVNSRGFLFVKI